MKIFRAGIAGIGCAILWFLVDRYLFGGEENWRYYTAVAFAFASGYWSAL